VWRITSAQKELSIKESEKLLLLSRIFSLLLRLLHGEEKNNLLFDYVKEGMIFLVDFKNENKESADILSNFECILALRILSALGYIGKMADFDRFTESPYFTPELLTAMSLLKTRAIMEINKALQETHL
jgi:hypothetical protein